MRFRASQPADRDPAGKRPSAPRGLARRIALCVFASTLLTAGLLSAVSVVSTRVWIAAGPGAPGLAGDPGLVIGLALVDLGLAALFGLIAHRVSRRLSRPIVRLAEAARSAARGEGDAVIPELDSPGEVGTLSRALDELIRQHRVDRDRIEAANRDLRDKNTRLAQNNEVLNQLSITDGLTKLHNHRFFQDHLTREIRRVDRAEEPLAILLLDIDDFKRLNDHQGHAAGDEVLRRIAAILNEQVRGSDLCARYGGEEFVVLTPNTGVQGAYGLAEKIRTTIAEMSFIVGDSMRPLRVTVSIGVAAFTGNRKSFFQKADQALYQAKADGKNCVIVHPDDEPTDA